jgi:murein DD-endopeptidase MepM/ murein hydrolase activator NlpD
MPVKIREHQVPTRPKIRFSLGIERLFPERRIFIKSESDTRFVRLRPGVQLLATVFVCALVGWCIFASAVLMITSLGAGNYREQAMQDMETYQFRLNEISSERDARTRESLEARARFNTALSQVSVMQTELMTSETRRRELETAIDVIQTTLRETMHQRDTAISGLSQLEEQNREASDLVARAELTPAHLGFLAEALKNTAAERDNTTAEAAKALANRDGLEHEILLMREQNDQIFRQLEEAMTISVEPLQRMFRAAGMQPDVILDQVRQGYSGTGGPLTPLEPMQTPQAKDGSDTRESDGEDHSNADILRANRVLAQLDELNLYRIATDKVPFALPVVANHRLSSSFGSRRDPITGGRRRHNGLDFAAPHGTDILAAADGVISYAGWNSGFGKLVKIRHAFGIETYYAHNTRIRVEKGQRVSRGQHIADMGSTGRSTGTHLHYEVRVNGKPVNPMTYIKAARNVF